MSAPICTSDANRLLAIVTKHGSFKCSVEDLDVTISRFLPASRAQLQLEASPYLSGHDLSDVVCISELLIMIADFHRPVSGHDW